MNLAEELQKRVGFDLPEFKDEKDVLDFIGDIINIKSPKWVTEEYEGSEEDFFEWLLEVARNTVFRGAIQTAKGSHEAEAKVDALIRQYALDRTRQATQKTERSFVYQLYRADKEQWYRNLPGELDTIEELLGTMVDALEEGTSKYSCYKYIVDTVMPIIKAEGGDVKDVWGIPNAISKAEDAVPAMRFVLKDQPLDQPISTEARDQLFDIVRGISDPSITVRPFRDQMKQITGKVRKALDPISIQTFFMPGGDQWYVIKAPDKRYARVVELGLAGMIERVDVTDGFSFVHEINMLMTKGTTEYMGDFNQVAVDEKLLEIIAN